VSPAIRSRRTTTPLPWQCDAKSCGGEIRSSAPSGRASFVWHIYPQADDAQGVKLDDSAPLRSSVSTPGAANALNASGARSTTTRGSAAVARLRRRFRPGRAFGALAKRLAALPIWLPDWSKICRDRL